MVVGYIFTLVLLVSIHMFTQEILILGRLVAAVILGKRGTNIGSFVSPSSSAIGIFRPSIPVSGQNAAFLLCPERSNITFRSADELCDELLMHMLDCDVCL